MCSSSWALKGFPVYYVINLSGVILQAALLAVLGRLKGLPTHDGLGRLEGDPWRAVYGRFKVERVKVNPSNFPAISGQTHCVAFAKG